MTDSEFRSWLKTATDEELKEASLEKRKNGNYTSRANLAQAERNKRCGRCISHVCTKAPSYIHQDNYHDYEGWI